MRNKIISAPPSKSISNRALVMAFLSDQEKIIRNVLKCDDTDVVIKAFETLKVDFEIFNENDRSFDIRIAGYHPSENVNATLNLNNAGTAVRFLIPALCAIEGEFTVTGSDRMLERPIKDLVDALTQLGARIEYLGSAGFLPLKIFGGNNRNVLKGSCEIKCDTSSQFLSGLLILQSALKNSFEIKIVGEIVSEPYVELTKDVISKFNSTEDFIVEGDASSASYFFAAGALKYPVTVANVPFDTKQADIKFLNALKLMGCEVLVDNNGITVYPTSHLKAIELDCVEFPDSAMTLAMLCAVADGRSRLSGLQNLKFKECDRLTALATEFSKLGIEVRTFDDGLEITGMNPAQCKPATIETYNDHRMAMCFAVLKLVCPEITILNPECVTKTYPCFWGDFVS